MAFNWLWRNNLKKMDLMNKKTETELLRKKQKVLLIEGCKEMSKDSLKILKEFKYADAEIDWK